MTSPYTLAQSYHFWSSGVKKPFTENQNLDLNNLLELIRAETIVCAAGSCFSQNIGKELLARDYEFLVSKFSQGRIESFGLGNVYTTQQLEQWLEFCLSNRTWTKDTFFTDKEHLISDYLIPHLSPVNSESELNKRRNSIKKEFISTLEKADLFIFTCGLTEQWETQTGEALAVCPGTIFGEFDESSHLFRNLTTSEVLNNLTSIERLIAQVNPSIKLLYTVSPVPLTATAEKEHVLLSNNFSKSKLRAAIGEHVAKSEKSSYFGSYELMVSNTAGDWRYKENLRSVSRAGINFVMRHSFNEHGPKREFQNISFSKQSDSELNCEEQKLETLRRNKVLSSARNQTFFIGDSHMGKIAEAASKLGFQAQGGQIMNGSGFSEAKFSLDQEQIFTPEEDKNSNKIWTKIFKNLERCNGTVNIFTNIGFQTTQNIPKMVNYYGKALLTQKDIMEYFKKFNRNQLVILEKLTKYGTVVFVEDPKIHSIIKEHPFGESHLRIERFVFPIYAKYMRTISKQIGARYFSEFDSIIAEIYQETGYVENVLSQDIVHGSELFYKKSAQKIYEL